MLRSTSGLVIAMCAFALASAPAAAQEGGAPKLELTLTPAGAVSFGTPDERPEPSFGTYSVGGSLTFNVGPVGIEGELGLALGRSQELRFGAVTRTAKTPEIVVYSVNLVVPVLGHRRIVAPYVTAGIGELTFMRTREVGQADTETFFAGNVGGGVKWYSNGRWGLRGDYRHLVMRSKFDAPGTFIGRELRRVNRFYGGVVIDMIR